MTDDTATGEGLALTIDDDFDVVEAVRTPEID